MYHTSPSTGFAGALICAYLRRPPPVMLPVTARSPPIVAAPITLILATDPNEPFSIVSPPTTARVPDDTMLPTLSTPLVAVIPPADR